MNSQRINLLLTQVLWRKNQHWRNNIRCIYSKTGVWSAKLSRSIRLAIEDHWKPVVEEHDRLQAEASHSEGHGKEKFYALSMFPYPSGNLHLGHVRVYTLSDVMARYQRACGKQVIHPMGWDAFGLPAENAAIERGIQPKEWTYSNIKKTKMELKNLGFSFDWNREFATCDPSYYRWTQYIFLKMFKKGLVFQKKGLVNWDPVDMTVLADEQIDDNGCSWRSGVITEKKYLKQWYLRNTVFSESLLDGLNEVDPALWRDIILLQKNWISECKGQRIELTVEMENGTQEEPLFIYTENLDLIYGVSHIAIAPSHHLCVDYGIFEEGNVLPCYGIHPFTGERLKMIVTEEDKIFSQRDVMLGIPSVSEDAKQTAEKLHIPFKVVLDPANNTLVNSQELSGLSRSQALEQVRLKAMQLGIGGEKISARLNDWLISRQRYWGTPIPIIHCPTCQVVPVPFEDLPVELPDTKVVLSKGGQSPLATDQDWLNVTCPKCKGPAKRETDTMDTFVDSSWYFLRFLDPNNDSMPFDPEIAEQYMPVDLYVGGKEHAILHLYYARFVTHFLHSLGWLPQREPFRNLLTQGMVKGQTFRVKATGKYLPADQVDHSGKEAKELATGQEVLVDWHKMSKTKHNGVSPQEVISEYGIDSTRLCILSNVAPQSDRNWSNEVYKGVLHWQGRIWTLVSAHREFHNETSASGDIQNEPIISKEESVEWEQKINNTRNHIINNVNFQFNTTFNINSAISRLHSFVSWLMQVPPHVTRSSRAYERSLADLVVMVGPMAPYFACEVWQGLSDVVHYDSHIWEKNVLDQPWPKLDEDFLIPLKYQVNNVAVSEIGIPFKDLTKLCKDSALELVESDPSFHEQFGEMEIQQVHLKVVQGHKASINLVIPEFDHGLKGKSASEKRKMEGKLGKKRKKLYSMKS